jgi:hypothetical protein
MKRFLLISLSCLVLTFLFVLCFQYILQLRSQKGALQVTSLPESKVYLNGKLIGQTPLCKCEAADMLTTGTYTIRLVPTKGGLPDFQEKITISEAVLTVVDRKFAPDSLSEGSVISLSPLTDKKKTELLVVSLPEGSTVFLDNNEIGVTPFSFKDPTESDHVLRIRKNGYKEKVVRIRTPLGYKLTVAAYLSTGGELSGTEVTQTASSSAELAVSPTPPLKGKTVLILDTPTGFLRVRETVGGGEIGRVTPGEVYQFVDEQEGWLQIKLKDGQQGWVSNQYAKEQ